ncbi:flagellar basal body-associated FliL family protein [Neptunomonas antarctica]|uniref:Flagellar protein FliL n=1 Tax=Neptunomonas antarctica TaxID=619304 RepID=A0A1N7MLD2_9GAMM|nr:flagellar basal body-associated FliL family protein [Neptunomonas antarctica]SIS86975.1 flagellar FliL protein [Neptunomonas antarctica]
MLLRFFAIVLLSLWLPAVWAAEEEAPAAAEYVGYVELKPFITNFGGEGKVRFLKCEVTIQVSSEDTSYAINHHMANVRNDLVFLFSAQTEADLETVEAQKILAKKGLALIQKLLIEEEGEAMVTDLFFTSFVIQ